MTNEIITVDRNTLLMACVFFFLIGVSVELLTRPSLAAQLDQQNLTAAPKGALIYPPDYAVFDNSTYALVHKQATYKSIAICRPDANMSLLCVEFGIQGGDYYQIIGENETLLSLYLAPFPDENSTVA